MNREILEKPFTPEQMVRRAGGLESRGLENAFRTREVYIMQSVFSRATRRVMQE